MIPAEDKFIVLWRQGNGRNVRWQDLLNFLGRYPKYFEGQQRGIKLMVKVAGSSGYAFSFKFENPAPDKHIPQNYVNGFIRQLYREGLLRDE